MTLYLRALVALPRDLGVNSSSQRLPYSHLQLQLQRPDALFWSPCSWHAVKTLAHIKKLMFIYVGAWEIITKQLYCIYLNLPQTFLWFSLYSFSFYPYHPFWISEEKTKGLGNKTKERYRINEVGGDGHLGNLGCCWSQIIGKSFQCHYGRELETLSLEPGFSSGQWELDLFPGRLKEIHDLMATQSQEWGRHTAMRAVCTVLFPNKSRHLQCGCYYCFFCT